MLVKHSTGRYTSIIDQNMDRSKVLDSSFDNLISIYD